MTQPCALPAQHHSTDRVKVYHGEVEPLILCGYHASTLGPATFEAIRAGAR